MARIFKSTSVDTTTTATLTSAGTSISVSDATALLAGASIVTGGDTFVVAISPDTTSEEICVVTNVSGNTLTLTRAQAGTTAVEHASGATVRHVLTSLELTEFATKAATETLTNKTINLANNTLTTTVAQLNTAITDGDIVTAASSDTLTNKTIALGSNTVSGTIAQFNTAVTDADLATLAGTETLTNKNVRLAGVDEKTGNYTLVAGDASKLISVNSTSNLTVTVPSGVFSVGDIVYLTRTGTGTVTIAASGTTLTSPDSKLKLRVRYSSAAIICTASNTFRVVGDLAA